MLIICNAIYNQYLLAIICPSAGKAGNLRRKSHPKDGDQGAGLLAVEENVWRADAIRGSQIAAVGEENTRLRRLVADLSLDKEVLQDAIQKNSKACSSSGLGGAYAGVRKGL